MPKQPPQIDITLARSISSPSPAFREFVNAYFVDQYRYRQEQDDAVLQRLTGLERDVAINLVLANLRTGEMQVINATVKLDLKEAVTTLQSMQTEDIYGDLTQFTISRALFSLGALQRAEFLERCTTMIRHCDEIVAYFILVYVYEDFPPDEAQPLIDIGLRRSDYSIRASAYKAAVSLQYVRQKGGVYTDETRNELWTKESAAVTVGSQQPMYYEQLQYYVGDKTYADTTVFERRLAELWSNDSKARRVPLFTEIN